MGMFFEGISFGFVLTILIGPIFIVTVHTSIEQGKRAGFAVTSGIWLSDILFILGTYFFINKIGHIIQSDGFDFWMSLVGGAILCLFGIVAFLKKTTIDPETLKQKTSLKSISGYFTKGFLVNTVNPFTVVFWLGTMSVNVLGRELQPNQAFSVLFGILTIIVITDSLKVIAADSIRNILTPIVLHWISRIAALGIFIGGLYFLYHGIVK